MISRTRAIPLSKRLSFVLAIILYALSRRAQGSRVSEPGVSQNTALASPVVKHALPPSSSGQRLDRFRYRWRRRCTYARLDGGSGHGSVRLPTGVTAAQPPASSGLFEARAGRGVRRNSSLRASAWSCIACSGFSAGPKPRRDLLLLKPVTPAGSSARRMFLLIARLRRRRTPPRPPDPSHSAL